MCTTLFLLSTLAMLWRRRFANRVQPEPSGLDGAVVGSNMDTDLQSSGGLNVCFLQLALGAPSLSSGPQLLCLFVRVWAGPQGPF
ncbi:photoreceptor disk component PRCD [Lynx rufus]|uniref:photoreceptor disk component PRCD n=1 Tax=Lynx rufus TaxID=61384 RepID=UPI001F125697|nr:photoreceptor disk component PRCD [Lynx rufus]